ncbi:hypothetical protein LZ31DRAFT_556076 [Colletotrichum somersetense]|nr:hypothetical protein LZ31DRAFT_556076 [Colletotrichum somersetense]
MHFSPVAIFLLGAAFSRSAIAIPHAFLDFDCSGKINDIVTPLEDAQEALLSADSATVKAVGGLLIQTGNLVDTRFSEKRADFENPHQADVDTLNADITKMLQVLPNTPANFALINLIKQVQTAVAVMTNTCKIDTP